MYLDTINPANKHPAIQEISCLLSFIAVYAMLQNKTLNNDFGKALEDPFCDILNRVYGYELANLNTVIGPNHKGIDLGEHGKSDACTGVQITTKRKESMSAKVTKTVTAMQDLRKEEGYTKYTNVLIFFVSEDKPPACKVQPDGFRVQTKNVIDLVIDISSLPPEKTAELAYIDRTLRVAISRSMQGMNPWNHLPEKKNLLDAKSYLKLFSGLNSLLFHKPLEGRVLSWDFRNVFWTLPNHIYQEWTTDHPYYNDDPLVRHKQAVIAELARELRRLVYLQLENWTPLPFFPQFDGDPYTPSYRYTPKFAKTELEVEAGLAYIKLKMEMFHKAYIDLHYYSENPDRYFSGIASLKLN